MRAIPFVPIEDEGAWWLPLSVRTMNEGLAVVGRTIPYTPGIGWLISLPSRLLGYHDAEWVMAFPLVVFAGVFFFIVEFSRSWREFLVAFFVWFYACLCSRDLHHLFVGMIYGEAACSLFLAGWLASFLSLNVDIKRSALHRALGFGLYVGFCAVIKPPLSVLSLLFAIPVGTWIFVKTKNVRASIAFLVPALWSYAFWRVLMASGNLKSEHTFSLSQIARAGIDFSIPIHMLSELFNRGTPQFAYSTALVATLAIAIILRSKTYLKLYSGTLLIYWGFVFGLYATIWQQTEQNSAGRYISHAAFALIYLLPISLRHSRHNNEI
jgi:hypothetical protein